MAGQLYEAMAISLDNLDVGLLNLVQREAGLSSEQLGERIGLSASAVQRRLTRLRKAGVISSTVAVVEPAQVGSPAFFFVGVELERERSELLAQLRAWIANEDAVQQAYYVTGNWDLLLLVVVPDVPSFDTFMSRFMAENPNVRRFTTSVVLATQKRGLFLPLPARIPR